MTSASPAAEEILDIVKEVAEEDEDDKDERLRTMEGTDSRPTDPVEASKTRQQRQQQQQTAPLIQQQDGGSEQSHCDGRVVKETPPVGNDSQQLDQVNSHQTDRKNKTKTLSKAHSPDTREAGLPHAWLKWSEPKTSVVGVWCQSCSSASESRCLLEKRSAATSPIKQRHDNKTRHHQSGNNCLQEGRQPMTVECNTTDIPEEPVGANPHSPATDSSEENPPSRQSSTSFQSSHSQRPKAEIFPKVLRESLLTTASGLYGIVLVVLGAVMPIAETFVLDSHPFVFEVFYIYLYMVSIGFILYVYLYLLRRQNRLSAVLRRALGRTFSRTSRMGWTLRRTLLASSLSRTSSTRSRDSMQSSGSGSRSRRRKVTYHCQPNEHTGSFYLRVGAIGFGVGSMVHSGLTFAHYFESAHSDRACNDVIQAVKPFLHLLFTFVQMYFVFMNSKMCINRYKTLARFGLMHMSSTNICIWLRFIVVETLHYLEIYSRNSPPASEVTQTPRYVLLATESSWEDRRESPDEDSYGTPSGFLPELECHWDALMGRVLEKASSYLYPCTIQYSLICGSVLYVMWSHVGKNPSPPPREDSVTSELYNVNGRNNNNNNNNNNNDEEDDGELIIDQRMSVDCSQSSKGMFLGFLLFVVVIITLVGFYVLVISPATMDTAFVLTHVIQSSVYLLILLAIVAASWRMRGLHMRRDVPVGVEQTLSLISLTGLTAFASFNLMAAILSPPSELGRLTIASSILMVLQAFAQVVFLFAAMRARAVTSRDVRLKPGREWVMFLLVSNFSLWVLNTFETQSVEHSLLQARFYGPSAWAIFCHVSVPLGIYFWFHSTVCLSGIWKNAWKIRPA